MSDMPSKRRVPRAIAWIAVAACLVLWPTAAAAPRPTFSLPQQIPPPERAKLEQVIEQAFVSTRMEAEPYVARPDIFEYLLNHPEFATHVTRALKLARYRIWRTPEGLFLDDGWGTQGHFEVVHAEPGLRVMYARGRYDPPLLPGIQGQAVVVMEYGFRPTEEGHTVVSTTITGYVKLESRFLRIAGMLVNPLAQAKADREARQLLKVFARVSRAIEERPDGVYDQVRQRPDVPQQELAGFRQLLDGR
ncbi:MAG: hypothetical protein HY215_08860 [Candidatus Rokubacteria bacterium]|nr:hypothetical protein [Candidatus Rokubacteria bacterium]